MQTLPIGGGGGGGESISPSRYGRSKSSRGHVQPRITPLDKELRHLRTTCPHFSLAGTNRTW